MYVFLCGILLCNGVYVHVLLTMPRYVILTIEREMTNSPEITEPRLGDFWLRSGNYLTPLRGIIHYSVRNTVYCIVLCTQTT